MVQDLKLDSERYAAEQADKAKRASSKHKQPGPGAASNISGERLGSSPSPNGLSGSYQNSDAHARRVRTGYATETPVPAPSQSSAYPPPQNASYAPPPVAPYLQDQGRQQQQPSPYNDGPGPYNPNSPGNISNSTYSSTVDSSNYAPAPHNGGVRSGYQQEFYDDRRGPPQPNFDTNYHNNNNYMSNPPMRPETSRPQFATQTPHQPPPPNTLR